MVSFLCIIQPSETNESYIPVFGAIFLCRATAIPTGILDPVNKHKETYYIKEWNNNCFTFFIMLFSLHSCLILIEVSTIKVVYKIFI